MCEFILLLHHTPSCHAQERYKPTKNMRNSSNNLYTLNGITCSYAVINQFSF